MDPLSLLLFIIILSLLVFVHELGHFLAARRAGIFVEEFGFGLPPRVWGKKVGQTMYSINALPIGGFVKLYGEDGEEQPQKNSKLKIEGKAFYEASLWQRLRVLLAGVFMNLLLGFISFSLVYFILGIPTPTGKVVVDGFTKDSPAKEAGIKEGDVIVSVDGQKITRYKELSSLMEKKAGEKVKFEIEREKDNPCQIDTGGKEKILADKDSGCRCSDNNLICYITPRKIPKEKSLTEGPLGVVVSDSVYSKNYPFWQIPFLGIKEGIRESFEWGKNIIVSLEMVFVGLFTRGQIPKEIAGPVGIYQVTKQVAKSGLVAILGLLGILSVNLSIVNILPFPALDGGRLIFLAYEGIRRKRPNPKVESWVNMIGMAFLLGLMALISLNDILRIVRK